MLYGLPPPTPKAIVNDMEKIFMTKEKMLEKRYINILEKVVKLYKDYEHEKVKEIKGIEVDKLLKDTEDYLKRLKELREQIEKRAQEKTIEQLYQDTFSLLKALIGKISQEKIIEKFEKEFIKTGKFSQQHFRILKNIVSARKEFKKGKMNSHKVDNARKDAVILINDLIEYSQRKDLVTMEKGRMIIKYKKDKKEQMAELLTCDNKTFLIKNNIIKKITNKIENSTTEELTKSIENQKIKKNIEISPKIFEILKKELGDFDIAL